MDALFDLYADEEQQQAFDAVGVLPALQQLLPQFDGRVKKESKSMNREHVWEIKEARGNLKAFIKYKQGLQ